MFAIETVDLTKDYFTGFWRPRPYRALDHLTLAVAPGEVFGFLGPNGAGKTTTLKLLMRLINPTAGRAAILGLPAGDVGLRRRIGYLPENPYFYDHLTAEELLTYSLLANLVSDLDREARWAGECLVLPKLGVQLHIEASPAMRVVQLVAAGPQQSYEGWRRLERALMPALRQTPGTRHRLGYTLVGCGVAMVAFMAFLMVRDPETVAQSLREMLRF